MQTQVSRALRAEEILRYNIRCPRSRTASICSGWKIFPGGGSPDTGWGAGRQVFGDLFHKGRGAPSNLWQLNRVSSPQIGKASLPTTPMPIAFTCSSMKGSSSSTTNIFSTREAKDRMSSWGRGNTNPNFKKEASAWLLWRIGRDAAGNNPNFIVSPFDPVPGKGFGKTTQVGQPLFDHRVAFAGVARKHNEFCRFLVEFRRR